MSITWKKAKILPKLYERVGKSLAGLEGCPKITHFKIGYGFIDETKNPPILKNLPDDMTDIPNVIYEGTTENDFSDNKSLFKCVIPETAVAEPTKATVIGLFEDNGNLLAAVSFLPEWLYPEKTYEDYVYIVFPQGGE